MQILLLLVALIKYLTVRMSRIEQVILQYYFTYSCFYLINTFIKANIKFLKSFWLQYQYYNYEFKKYNKDF